MKVRPPKPLTATITPQATWVFTDDERSLLRDRLMELAGQKVDIEIAPHQDTRSAQANAYLWGVVYKLMVEHGETGYADEELHDAMCERFLSRRRFVVTNKTTGEIEEREIPRRSSKLKIGEFYDFVEKVRLFAAEFLMVETPDPDPLYWRKKAAA